VTKGLIVTSSARAGFFPICGREFRGLLLVSACAGATTQTAQNEAANCGELQSAAREGIAKAIEANLTCTKDTDCETVAFSSRCFDSCTRVIGASGQGAYESAVTSANAGKCAEYETKACPKPTIPPCAPPEPPACLAGKCT